MRSFRLLVTVGTTEFDELMRCIDNEDFLFILFSNQAITCSELTVQYGRGKHEFNFLKPEYLERNYPQLKFSSFRYCADLSEVIKESDLVISHCGAGTILEVKKHRKESMVVVNDTLQDNHQTELSDVLEKSNLMYVANKVDDVIPTLHRMIGNSSLLQNKEVRSNTATFPILDASNFVSILEEFLSFS